MKILFMTNFFPPHHWAGTEIYTYTLARELQRAGHAVHVLCAGHWDQGDRYWNGHSDEVYNDIPVRRLHVNWALAPDPFRYLYDNPVIERYMQAYLGQAKPDVVHVTSCYSLSASVIQAAKHAGLPVVLTLADFWFICPRINLLHNDQHLCDGLVAPWECLKCMLWKAKAYRWPRKILPESVVARLLTWISKHPQLTRRRGLRGMAGNMEERRAFLRQALNQADLILLPSRFLKDIFVGHGASGERLRVIHWGLDTSWAPVQPKRIRSDHVRVGYIGRIAPVKGVHLLIEAFKNLNGRAELCIHGNLTEDPAYSASLRLLAGSDPRIRFEGPFPNDRLGDVLSQIDVLVVPSTWHETFCLVVREGFISKTPVIGANMGAIPEVVVHGQNGFLFRSGDVGELAHYLQMVVEDPALLDRLRAGIPPVKTVTEEVAELLAVYQQLPGVTSLLHFENLPGNRHARS